MTIQLRVLPNSDWQPLADWLTAMGHLKAVHDVSTCYLEPEPFAVANCWFCYQRPAPVLEKAIKAGISPLEAMENWVKHVKAMLAAYQSSNGASALINLDTLAAAPEQAVYALAADLETHVKGVAPVARTTDYATPLGRPAATMLKPFKPESSTIDAVMNTLLIHYVIGQQPDVEPLLATLDSAALPLTEPPFKPEPPAPLSPAAILKQWQQAHQDYRAQVSEKALLDKQLDAQLVSLQTQGKQLYALKDRLTQQQRETAAAQQDLEEENSLLLDQLNTVQVAYAVLNDNRDELNAHSGQTIHRLEQHNLQLQQRVKQLSEQSSARAAALDDANRKLARQRDSMQRAHALALFQANQFKNALSGRKAKRFYRQAREEIEASGLFDRNWYLTQYPDVARAGRDPIEHFLVCGAQEGRHPGPTFDTLSYLVRCPNVVSSGMNPLLHYLRNELPGDGATSRGVGESRSP